MTNTSKGTKRAPVPRVTFMQSLFAILVVIAVANTVELLYDRAVLTGEESWKTIAFVVAGVAAALGVAFLAWRWRWTLKLCASLRFGAAMSLVLAGATALGTLIVQGLPPEAFQERFGSASTVLAALHVGDLFHSFWFLSLLWMTGAALGIDGLRRLVRVIRGRSRLQSQLGYLLTHLGIVIALIGGFVSMTMGQKGMIELLEGMATDNYYTMDPDTGKMVEKDLDFMVRLDRFELEYHDPAFSVYVYELFDELDEEGRRKFELLAALRADERDKRTVAGDWVLAVEDFVVPGETKEFKSFHSIVGPDGVERPMEVGERTKLGGGLVLELVRFLPHFNFDIKRKQAVSMSDRPENPAAEVLVTRESDGQMVYRGWLFANHPGFAMDGHGEGFGERLTYRYARPEVHLTLTRKSSGESKDMRLSLAEGSRLPIKGREIIVRFDKKGNRIKQYHSTVSIRKGDRTVVEKEPVWVNNPLWFEGWALYQTNFREYDLRYSGFQIVRDPGLSLVYIGLSLMVLGIIVVLYFRRLKTKAPDKTKDTFVDAEDILATQQEGGA